MIQDDQKLQNQTTKHYLHMSKAHSLQVSPQDTHTIAKMKRQTSCEQSNEAKNHHKTQHHVHQNMLDPSNFSSYNVGTDFISFEIQEQRNKQMKVITNDQQLQAYYLAFKKLFSILYQASFIIQQKTFNLDTDLFQNKSIRFLSLVFEQTKETRNHQFLVKMKPLASNMLFLASTHHQFERRIDLVARKVTLQNDKRQQIKNAFLNPKIALTWQHSVSKFVLDQETKVFVQGQLAKHEQKFCFIEIKEFIVNKLSNEAFDSQLRKCCVLEQLDDDLSLDFKFEFLLAEEFTFIAPKCLMKDNLKPQKPVKQEPNKCELM